MCGMDIVLGVCSHQLHELSSTQVDLPALGSAHHSSLIGHVLQRALLLVCTTKAKETSAQYHP